MKSKQLLVLLALVIPMLASAQENLPMPRVSPQASVSQHLGNYISLQVDYSRPAANGRDIWGKLISYGLEENPYGNQKPMPWRLGANESTVIMVSHDTKVNGKYLAAGSYSLHLILKESGEATLIFNKNTAQWGSFFYEDSEDVLRVDTKLVESGQSYEWFTISLDPNTETSLNLSVKWGTKKLDYTFDFDVREISIKEIDKVLTEVPGFYDTPWGQAAQYVLSSGYDVEKGLNYINRAIKMNPSKAPYFFTKSMLLAKKGDNAASEEAEKMGIDKATDLELNRYGNTVASYMTMEKALKLHQMNVKKFGKSWIAYKGLADTYAKMDKKSDAKKAYEKCLKYAPDNQKERIKKLIDAQK